MAVKIMGDAEFERYYEATKKELAYMEPGDTKRIALIGAVEGTGDARLLLQVLNSVRSSISDSERRCREVEKMCAICRQIKPETEFRLMKRKKGDSRLYRNSYCKDCEKWYMRNYMRQRREKSAHNEAATSGALRNKNNYILSDLGGNASGRENRSDDG